MTSPEREPLPTVAAPWRVERDEGNRVTIYHGDRRVQSVWLDSPAIGWWASGWHKTLAAAVQSVIDYWDQENAKNAAQGLPEFWAAAPLISRADFGRRL